MATSSSVRSNDAPSVSASCRAARGAWRDWARLEPGERARVIGRAAGILAAQADSIAETHRARVRAPCLRGVERRARPDARRSALARSPRASRAQATSPWAVVAPVVFPRRPPPTPLGTLWCGRHRHARQLASLPRGAPDCRGARGGQCGDLEARAGRGGARLPRGRHLLRRRPAAGASPCGGGRRGGRAGGGARGRGQAVLHGWLCRRRRAVPAPGRAGPSRGARALRSPRRCRAGRRRPRAGGLGDRLGQARQCGSQLRLGAAGARRAFGVRGFPHACVRGACRRFHRRLRHAGPVPGDGLAPREPRGRRPRARRPPRRARRPPAPSSSPT